MVQAHGNRAWFSRATAKPSAYPQKRCRVAARRAKESGLFAFVTGTKESEVILRNAAARSVSSRNARTRAWRLNPFQVHPRVNNYFDDKQPCRTSDRMVSSADKGVCLGDRLRTNLETGATSAEAGNPASLGNLKAGAYPILRRSRVRQTNEMCGFGGRSSPQTPDYYRYFGGGGSRMFKPC